MLLKIYKRYPFLFSFWGKKIGSIIKVGVRDRAYKKFQKSRAYLPKIR